jgi:hypothetical protein
VYSGVAFYLKAALVVAVWQGTTAGLGPPQVGTACGAKTSHANSLETRLEHMHTYASSLCTQCSKRLECCWPTLESRLPLCGVQAGIGSEACSCAQPLSKDRH